MIRDPHSERLLELHLPRGRICNITVGVEIEHNGKRYQGVGSEPSAVTWELIRRIRNAKKEGNNEGQKEVDTPANATS